MERENQFQINLLRNEHEALVRHVDDLETRQREMEKFKESTVEKLLVIFEKLDELRKGDQFIKRVFITSLVGAICSGLVSVIIWAFQN